ncbi:MAG: hypothetical protein AB2L24_21970 [Mangrovibacterium sp.]
MKKLILFLFTAVLAASCEGPAGPMGPPGEGANWEVTDFNITSWDRDAQGGFFFKHYTFHQLDDFIYNDGIVIAYIEFNGAYQTPLPYTRYREEVIGGEAYRWSELIDFEYTVGEITFYLTPSDFDTVAETPAPARIRVVLLW